VDAVQTLVSGLLGLGNYGLELRNGWPESIRSLHVPARCTALIAEAIRRSVAGS
jgi:hypothetical protein